MTIPADHHIAPATAPSDRALRRSSRSLLIAIGLVVALYLLTRLPALLRLPIFLDEATYLLRAQLFPARLADTFHEGKLLQELFLPLLVRLPANPLLLSRLLSAACGLGTVLALIGTGSALGRIEAGLLAGAMYSGAPIAVLHDRLGLSDSMLACVAAWLLLACALFARQRSASKRGALAIGGLVVLAMLVKITGLFLSIVPLLAVLALAPAWTDRFARLAGLRIALIVVLAALASLVLLNYSATEQHKTQFLAIDQRIAILGEYIRTIARWIAAYLPGMLLPLPIAMLAILRTHPLRGAVAWLLACAAGFCSIILSLGTTLYPRYLLPIWPAFLLACALSAVGLWQWEGRWRPLARLAVALTVAATFVWDGFFVVQLQREPLDAPMVAEDRVQYLESWSAGYQIPEIIDLLRQMAIDQHGIRLVNHDQPRLIHLAPEFYLRDNAQVVQSSLDLQLRDAPDQLRRIAFDRPAYVLLDEEENRAFDFARRFSETRLLRVFVNPLGTMRFYLYVQPAASKRDS